MDPKLIKTIAEVRAQVPVSMTSDFDVIKPFLLNAENNYLVKIIGKAQVDALKEDYDGDTDDEDFLQAIDLCQKIISNFGYYYALPILSVSVGSSGVQVFSNQDTKQAFQWQVTDLRDSLQGLGFSGIEDLLIFLESNPEDFPEYAASEEFLRNKQYLITTAGEFSRYFNIDESRYVFQAIAYLMKRVEDQVIAKNIGSSFYSSLKEADLSENKQYLVDNYLKPGLALLTASKAIMERIITFKDGVYTYNLRGKTDNSSETQALGVSQVADLCSQLTTDGNQFLQDGVAFINANLADMTGFEPQTARRRYGVTNKPQNGVYIP